MAFTVLLTNDAAADLEELYVYISRNDSSEKADYVLERLEEALSSLSESPERGAYPKELLALGVREYREIFFKPCRIIYRFLGKDVHVLLIVNGRRDLQALLHRRLLEA